MEELCREELTLGIPDLQRLTAQTVQDAQEPRLKCVPEHAAASRARRRAGGSSCPAVR